MFAAVSSVITKTWKQPKCLSTLRVLGHPRYRMPQGRKEEHVTGTHDCMGGSKTLYTLCK